MGDGRCNGDLNTAEWCGYDGEDCGDEFNAKYPNCDVFFPFLIGDGVCCDSDLHVRYFGENYNTLECQYDGGEYPCFLRQLVFENVL